MKDIIKTFEISVFGLLTSEYFTPFSLALANDIMQVLIGIATFIYIIYKILHLKKDKKDV